MSLDFPASPPPPIYSRAEAYLYYIYPGGGEGGTRVGFGLVCRPGLQMWPRFRKGFAAELILRSKN